ncbi:protease complex subunit PrcB family protein [Ammoniphilus sp. CFH 90114]|uniref:protease complex subunit PrcB family protein n=1 Tax=Ammoniphilus sp. CFH 90114 TaxID=2493665 RepID=UPI0013E986B8|nr:protease complex subunit PrcB family protein [Ammoniphilus sp. CFH 90114]
MKRFGIDINWQVIFCLLLSLAIVTGCTVQAAGPGTQERKDATVNFELLKAPYPAFVDDVAKSMKQKGGSKVIHKNGHTYVVIALGQRPSAGYSVIIDNVQHSDGKLVITYEEKKPQGMAASVITYPVTVVKMTKTDLPVKVKSKK